MTLLGAIFEVSSSIDKLWDLLGHFDKKGIGFFQYHQNLFYLSIGGKRLHPVPIKSKPLSDCPHHVSVICFWICRDKECEPVDHKDHRGNDMKIPWLWPNKNITFSRYFALWHQIAHKIPDLISLKIIIFLIFIAIIMFYNLAILKKL